MRTVLFNCHFRRYRGAHLKLWDYFGHVLAMPGFTAKIGFSYRSRWDATNPWVNAREHVVERWGALAVDIFFLSGRDWFVTEHHPSWGADTPVVNLIQHVRHAEPNDDRYRYLRRKAIRICVSEEVAQALRDTGIVRGPIIVIPNGIDLEGLPPSHDEDRPVDLLIAALKQPALGERLGCRMERSGRRVRVLSERLPRPDYLRALEEARVTLFLPHETEGFYLPALEGLALGTLVVCPDCIGNRSFCLPGHNAFRPSFVVEDLVAATEAALALHPEQAGRMRANARETAAGYSLNRERQAFFDVLHNIDRLWQDPSASES